MRLPQNTRASVSSSSVIVGCIFGLPARIHIRLSPRRFPLATFTRGLLAMIGEFLQGNIAIRQSGNEIQAVGSSNFTEAMSYMTVQDSYILPLTVYAARCRRTTLSSNAASSTVRCADQRIAAGRLYEGLAEGDNQPLEKRKPLPLPHAVTPRFI